MFKSKFIEKDTIISWYPKSLALTRHPNHTSRIELKFILDEKNHIQIKPDIKNIKFYIFEKNNKNKILFHAEYPFINVENDPNVKFIFKNYFQRKLKLEIKGFNEECNDYLTLCELPKEKYEVYATDDYKLVINAILEEE